MQLSLHQIKWHYHSNFVRNKQHSYRYFLFTLLSLFDLLVAINYLENILQYIVVFIVISFFILSFFVALVVAQLNS